MEPLLAALATRLLELGHGSRGGCIEPGEAARGFLSSPSRIVELARRLEGVEAGEACIRVAEPLRLALHAVRLGSSPQAVARWLDWRMFEEYAAGALAEAGYEVRRGLRLHGRGGFEVDVLGYMILGRRLRGVVVECKHWSPRPSSPSRLRRVAEAHLERTRRLAAAWQRLGLPPVPGGGVLMPAVLVLREHGVPRMISGVPVVPVSRLRGFLEELDALLYGGDAAVVELPPGG